jgi:hypothetical protein
MCTRMRTVVAVAISCAITFSACSGPERTGTSFCKQLGNELPYIGQRISTAPEASAMVRRYQRLLERAPLTIEGDLAILTELLQQASQLDASDASAVQKIADASYAAQQSAISVRDWVKSTCAVDISTGLNIDPPRVAPTTTVAAATSTSAP